MNKKVNLVLKTQNVINRVLILIIMLVSNISLSQKKIKSKHVNFQEAFMKTAKKWMLKKQLGKAYFSYQLAIQEDSTSNKGKIALHKSDSLKTILRTELIVDIQGTWKQRATSSNWGNKSDKTHKVLVISNNTILFYEIDKKNKKSELIKREQIEFNNIPDLWPTYAELIFSDRQIWNISVSSNKKYLTMKKTGKMIDKKTRNQTVCDNTSISYEKIK